MRRPSPLSLPLVAAALVGGLAVAWQLTVPEAPVMAALENDQDLAAGVRLVGPDGPRAAALDREAAASTAMAGPGPLAAVTADEPRPVEAALRLRTLATHLAPEAAPGAAAGSAASAPAPVTVRVLVRDPQGTAVPGARVIATPFTREGEARPPQWVDSSSGSLERVPLTNAEGWSTLVVPAMARLRLTVLTPGEGKVLHTRDVQALREGERREVVLQVASAETQGPGPEASGLTASGPSAPALPGTWSVQAWSSEGRALHDLRWTSLPLSEIGGAWDLPERVALPRSGRTLLPGPEPHVALIEADGCAPRLVVPAPTEPQRAQRLELQPGGSLVVHTRGPARLIAEALLPIEGRLPAAAEGDAPRPRVCAVRWSARSSGAGWLCLESLPTGIPLQLSVEPGSSALPAVVTLAPGEQRELDLAPMGGPHTLDGRLLAEDGARLAGRELWLVPAARAGRVLLAPDVQPTRRLFTDAGGSFHLEGLPRAAWWLAPAPGSGLLAEASWFECLPGQAAVKVTVTGRAAVPGRVVVRDGEGLPVAGAALRIEDARGQLLALRHTDARGTVATSVPRTSNAWVQVLASPVSSRSERAPLTGATACLLEVERGRAIQVLVHGPGGHVVPGPFEAVLTTPDGAEHASTHDSPVIRVRVSEPGPHGLVVRDGQGRLAVASVESDDHSGPVPLELRPTAAMELINQQDRPLRWELLQGGTTLRAGILHAGNSTEIHAQAREASLRITAPGVARPLEQHLVVEDGRQHALGLPR